MSTNVSRRKWSKEEIIPYLQQAGDKFGLHLATYEYRVFVQKHHSQTCPELNEVIACFGDWNQAKLASGLKSGERAFPSNNYSDSELLELLVISKKECGGKLTCSTYIDWRNKQLTSPTCSYSAIPSYPTIMSRFPGGWKSVQQKVSEYEISGLKANAIEK
ncbi:hypothetical protein CN918_30785 [Priestia megaterium]|nr:hypothetical protein CN918_30785 [Priestia megaterium]